MFTKHVKVRKVVIMKKSLMEFGCISVMVALLCSCIGCASLAEQMTSQDAETRASAKRAYQELSPYTNERMLVESDLIQLVFQSYDEALNLRAVKALVELGAPQSDFVALSFSSNNRKIRQACIREVVDQELIKNTLATVSLPCYVYSNESGRYIWDNLGSASYECKWYEEVAMAYVQRLTDQKIIEVVAKEACSDTVRLEAIKRVENQALLAEFAMLGEKSGNLFVEQGNGNRSSVDIRPIVMKRVKDQKLLVDIAKKAKAAYIRLNAVEQVTDQVVLVDLWEHEKDERVRDAILDKINDSHPIKQKYYATYAKTYDGIFLNVPHVPIYDAVTKLTDQKLLADVAKNAKNTEVSARVAKKLVEQDLLFDVAMNSKHGMAAEITASKLKNQKQIIEVLKKSKFRGARLAVVKKVKDINVLKTVVKTTRNDKELSGEIAGQINTLNCFDSSTSFEQIKFDKPFTATSGNVASGNYRLTKNVELTSSIRVAAGNVVRIDLANFSIGGADIIVSKGARLELFNGKIKRTLEHDDLNALVGRAECQIRNEGFLVLENTEVKIRIKNNLGSLRLMEFNFLMTGGTFDTSDKTTIDLTHGYLWGHIVQNGKFIPLSEGQILFKAEGKKVDDVVVVGALPGKFVARLPRGYFVEERPSKIEGLVDLVIVRE